MRAELVPNMIYNSSTFSKVCKIANNLNYDQVICLMSEDDVSRTEFDKQ